MKENILNSLSLLPKIQTIRLYTGKDFIKTESSVDSNGVNQVLDTMDMKGNDESMATEDNDSQTWHQITHKDITIHQMLQQFKAINTLCLNPKRRLHLTDNKNSVHLNKRFVCDFKDCNKSFPSNSGLIRHKSCVHLNEKPFKCNEENCGKSFGNKSHFNRHKRIHSGEKPFPVVCDFKGCNKSFNWKSLLIQHKNSVHLNTRFVCGFNGCKQSCKSKTHLNRHKNCVHLKVKPFKCNEENCGKSFGVRAHLNRHKSTHSGEKLFVCDYTDCDHSFAQKYNLFQHKKCVHLNVKPFKCNEENCGKSFGRKSQLIEHKLIHSGEKPGLSHQWNNPSYLLNPNCTFGYKRATVVSGMQFLPTRQTVYNKIVNVLLLCLVLRVSPIVIRDINSWSTPSGGQGDPTHSTTGVKPQQQ
ncbi:unnamed protein product [Medioppia subpectinata]|uniref:C2H2-type domain-containing protein n=1 Tax=Medioppia subpectinata TaxID=1979941 RepID=A0A7R9KQS3_9ACAR|nr:unnamed protein product [Medioppia subpectinata]CAG2106968.1 unnamed protein product [Medioppia subpectinata]